MLKLVTTPDREGRYWTLTVHGRPCAAGRTDGEDKAIMSAMNWCRLNGYGPRGLEAVARNMVGGGERIVYEAML